MHLTIAHVSDVHLAPLGGLGLRHVNVKRALGLVNWLIKRRKIHLREVVDAMVADIGRQQVDHVVVSGDLANLGLPGEHEAALTWLGTLGTPAHVSVVPGNHDIYCRLRRDRGVERWLPHMTSDAAGGRYVEHAEFGFPYVRLLGRLAIIGVNSAIPTRPFSAIGQVGPRQLKAVADALEALGRDRFTRVVVIHHPPLPGQADERRGLVDASLLEQVLLTHGAELVLHGHNHRDMHAVRRWPRGRIDVVGVASASTGRVRPHQPLGRYNLIRLDAGNPGGPIEIVSRGIAAPDGPVVEIGRQMLGGAVEIGQAGSPAVRT